MALNKYPKAAVGTETRGKTAANRLRRVDNFVTMYCRDLILDDEHLFIDLGFGFTPITTLESARCFRKYNPQLRVLGTELDNKRAREAQQFADDLTSFRQGGFNIPLQTNEQTGQKETVNLIRAFNVLRQYDLESECRQSHILMGSYLNVNGILIEGTSDVFGRIWVANIIRKQLDHSLAIEALVFSTNFHSEFNIVQFQQILPKNFIHRMTGSNEMIYNFFHDWKQSYQYISTSQTNIKIKQLFSMTAKYLVEEYGYNLITRKKYLKYGFLIWILKPNSKGVDSQQITYPMTNIKQK